MDRGAGRHSNVERAKGHAGDLVGARVFLTLTLALATSPARAHEPNVAIDDTAACCMVHGDFLAPVSASVAWDVLTDYDHIPKFVSSMRASHVERSEDGGLLVRQDAVGGVLLFHRR